MAERSTAFRVRGRAVTADPPAVEIRIPLEGIPQVRLSAVSYEDEQRLTRWAKRATPRLSALIAESLEALRAES